MSEKITVDATNIEIINSKGWHRRLSFEIASSDIEKMLDCLEKTDIVDYLERYGYEIDGPEV